MPVMSPAKKKTGTANLRTWRISILRNRVQFLGFVEAPNRQAAEAAAAKQFNISEEVATVTARFFDKPWLYSSVPTESV